jgi:hypothetical protein
MSLVVGGKGGGGGRGEKWTKPCMHIWIIKEKWNKKQKTKNKTKMSLASKQIIALKYLLKWDGSVA